MQCPYCGNDIPSGVPACPSCGADVGDNALQPLSSTTSGQPVQAPQVAGQSPAKSQMTYALLGALLGSLGVHNFYAGYTSKGVIQLLITILSCGGASLVPWIWAIIEICTVKQDAEGIPFV